LPNEARLPAAIRGGKRLVRETCVSAQFSSNQAVYATFLCKRIGDYRNE